MVRYGTVGYLPPLPGIREYGTVRYITVGYCKNSCGAALHVSSLDLRAGLRTPFTCTHVCLDLPVSTVPWYGRTVRYGTVLYFLINGLELYLVITVPWDPGVPQ